MNKAKLIIPIVLVVVFLVSFNYLRIGQGKDVELYGEALTDQAPVKIVEIMKNKDQYMGKFVKVEGKIVNECPSGCWFNLTDDTGTLYIDLFGANLAIPQKVGHNVILEGTIAERSGIPMIKGIGVKFK